MMIRNVITGCLLFLSVALLTQSVHAQTSTQNLSINGGSFTGSLGGQIDLQVKSQTTDGSVQTQGQLNITDLDISTNATGGPGINIFPNSSSQNNTASTPINITPTTIGINLPTTAFASGVTGSMSITANDQISNGIVGVLDPGVPGSDGAWDAPIGFGYLPNAQLNSTSVTVLNPITSNATISGGPILASIPNDVTIPNIVSGIIQVDLRVKNSSTVSVAFDPIQSVSIQGLTLSTSAPIPLGFELPDQFSPGSHPAPGASAMLDLSTGGGALANTQISGTLVSNITGTVSANVDIAADVRLDLGIFGSPLIGTFDQNDVINGPISTGSLLSLSENIALPDTQLPFSISVIHDANANVDLDDVIAQLVSGTFGFTFPIGLFEPDVVLPLPTTDFLIANQSFSINERLIDLPFGDGGDTFARGTVNLQRLEGNLGGNIVIDIDANLALNASLLAQALGQAQINVVPEPGSLFFVGLAVSSLTCFTSRRKRLRC